MVLPSRLISSWDVSWSPIAGHSISEHPEQARPHAFLMDDVVHVGDRQNLPRVSGDAARPVENFLVEVRAEEFFFVADDIGKAKHASAHGNPQIGRRKGTG